MAIVFNADLGGTFNNAAATTLVLTTIATAAANTKIVVTVGGNAAPTSVADSAGTTYRLIGSGIVNGAANVYIYEGDAASGLASGGTITATYGSSTSGRMVMASSLTGVGTGTASVEASQTRTQVSQTTWSANAITPAANNEMVFASASSAGGADATNTAGGGFTVIRSSGGSTRNWATEYLIQTTASAATASGTWSASQTGADGANMVVVFKPGGFIKTGRGVIGP